MKTREGHLTLTFKLVHKKLAVRSPLPHEYHIKQHAYRKWQSLETQLTMVINDWAEILDNQGHVDTFILDFEKVLIHPLMISLKANCLATKSEDTNG